MPHCAVKFCSPAGGTAPSGTMPSHTSHVWSAFAVALALSSTRGKPSTWATCVTISPSLAALRRTVTFTVFWSGSTRMSPPRSVTGFGESTNALFRDAVSCARITAESGRILPVSRLIAEAPATAAASAAFCSSDWVAMTFATSMPMATKPSIMTRNSAVQMMTTPRSFPRRVAGVGLCIMVMFLPASSRLLDRAIRGERRQGRGRRFDDLRRDHDQQVVIDGFGTGVGEEEAEDGDLAQDRHFLHDLGLVGLLEAADHEVLAGVEIDGRRGLAGDERRHHESGEPERIAEVDLAHLGRDLERDAVVLLDGRGEVQLHAELLPLDGHGRQTGRGAGRDRNRDLAAGQERRLFAAARGERRVGQRAEVAVLLERPPGGLQQPVGPLVVEEAVGGRADRQRDRRIRHLGRVQAALEEAAVVRTLTE